MVKNKRVLITFHSLGDCDAVASAFALKSWLKNSTIITPDSINAQAKKLLDFLGFKLNKFPNKYEKVIVIDTNSLSLLSNKISSVDCVIDHHAKHHDLIPAKYSFIDETYSSTSEMVYELLRELGEINEKSAICMGCGILSDSAIFKNATKRTFKYFHELLQLSKMEYIDLLKIIEVIPDISERMEILKGYKKANLIKVKSFLILTSIVSSFESIIATSFIETGADFAFVGCRTKEVRISGRMRSSLANKIDLAKIMSEVGEALCGSGGGHPTAAAVNLPHLKSVSRGLKECLKITTKKLLSLSNEA